MEAWRSLSEEEKIQLEKAARRVSLPDPVNSQLQPDLYIGSTSEKYRNKVKDYLSSDPSRVERVTKGKMTLKK